MEYDIVSLFNHGRNREEGDLNQVIQRQELFLSELQLQELDAKKEEALKANHLIDLSSESQRYIAEHLDRSTLTTKENYFQCLVDLQESFYFLRSTLPFSYSDMDILEKLLSVFEEYEGSVSHAQGVLEEWTIKENLERGVVDEQLDDSI